MAFSFLVSARDKLSRRNKQQNGTLATASSRAAPQELGPYAFPSFPPPSPAEILADRAGYQLKLRSRRYMAPEGVFEDTSIYALYRIYEYLVVDYVTGYRNQIEYFWRQRSWAVSDIPDPEDPDPSRYAFLACTTQLLVKAFNNLIKEGLPREARALLLPEELEAFKAQPESQRKYERIPAWAEKVQPLPETLVMVSHDDVILDGLDDERADAVFREKNILIWGPHIYFT